MRNVKYMSLKLMKCVKVFKILPSLPLAQSHQWLLFGLDRPKKSHKSLSVFCLIIKDETAAVTEKQELTGDP